MPRCGANNTTASLVRPAAGRIADLLLLVRPTAGRIADLLLLVHPAAGRIADLLLLVRPAAGRIADLLLLVHPAAGRIADLLLLVHPAAGRIASISTRMYSNDVAGNFQVGEGGRVGKQQTTRHTCICVCGYEWGGGAVAYLGFWGGCPDPPPPPAII